MPKRFIVKICFTIKVNLICGAGQDTKNLCHKLNSQCPVLKILGVLEVTSARDPVPGSWVSRSQFRGPGCQGLVSQGPRVPESLVLSLRVSGLGLRVPWS